MGTEHQKIDRSARGAVAGPASSLDPAPPAPHPVITAPVLSVGAADDRAEVDADAMADSALRRLQGDDGIPLSRQHAPSGGQLRRAAAAPAGMATSAPIGRAGGVLDARVSGAIEQARGSGRSLRPETLQRMESAFGTSFGEVRIHDDSASASLNRSVSAHAFTTGRDIFFGQGKFQPGTAAGERMLAHELAHTVQHRGTVSRIIDPAARPIRRDDTDVKDPTAPVATANYPGDGLTGTADAALTMAKGLNPVYAEVEAKVRAWVTKSQQKEIGDIASVGQRSKDDADKRALKDGLRAFLLMDYVKFLDKSVMQSGAGAFLKPTKDQRKAMDTKYFPKTLESRNNHRGLIEKGPYAPESASMLAAAGLSEAIVRTEVDRAKDAGGPKIDVRNTFIGDRKLGRMHLFLVYTSAEGDQWYFRGGPDDHPDGVGADITVAEVGRYEPGGIDWDPAAKSVTIAKGDAAKAKVDTLFSVAKQIGGMEVPYLGHEFSPNKAGIGSLGVALDGENCNSVAWTLLDMAGLPKKKPSGAHPGWGHILGEHKKAGKAKLAPLVDDTGAVGTPMEVIGKATKQHQLFLDRKRIEKAETLPGGGTVEVLEKYKDRSKIRYGAAKKVAWIDTAGLKTPRVVGRPFFVNLSKDRSLPMTSNTGVDLYARGGGVVEVLDAAYTSGQAKLIVIRYVDRRGAEYEATINGNQLSDVDPAKAPPKAAPDKKEAKAKKAQKGKRPADVKVGGPKPMAGKIAPVADARPVDKAPQKAPEAKASGGAKEMPLVQKDQIMLYNEDGTAHAMKGLMAARGVVLFATGEVGESDQGKSMVEFFMTAGTRTVQAWMTADQWKALYGSVYPGL